MIFPLIRLLAAVLMACTALAFLCIGLAKNDVAHWLPYCIAIGVPAWLVYPSADTIDHVLDALRHDAELLRRQR